MLGLRIGVVLGEYYFLAKSWKSSCAKVMFRDPKVNPVLEVSMFNLSSWFWF
jgi:hypothetical protein